MEGGQPIIESTLISSTPSRPKRYSPSFDRNDEDWEEFEGRRSPATGEGKTTGNLEHDVELRLNSPSMAKRRKLELWDQWTPSNISSCSGTPSRGTTPDTTMEDYSVLSTPTDSPAGTLTREERRDFKKRYKKDELWPAIESNYHYLMDEGIIETCKSTDDEDTTVNTKVSFTEFMQQYKELTDWLTQIQVVTQRKGTSRSEKYLNQTYHEELLQSSPRRELFNDYAKQLVKRYPSLKEEINMRMQHLNKNWRTLEEAVSPQYGYQDTKAMLKDLELDLSCIKKWLNGVEVKLNLLPLCSVHSWTVQEIEAELKKHQILQREIELQSKIISPVLKLIERLQNGELEEKLCMRRDAHQVTALTLERRWHSVWLCSLEWHCTLEEALAQLQGLSSRPQGLTSSDPDLWRHFTTFNNSSCSSEENISYGSDTGACSSDVIPFSPDEYEKIADTDELEELHSVSEPISALRVASKSVLSKMKNIADSRDVGYSSEGCSTDEQYMYHSAGLRIKTAPAKSPESGVAFSLDPGTGSSEDGENSRPSINGSLVVTDLTEPAAPKKDSPWRLSLTSAYDSDPDGQLTSENGGLDYKAIISTPTQELYRMTAVDTDFSDSNASKDQNMINCRTNLDRTYTMGPEDSSCRSDNGLCGEEIYAKALDRSHCTGLIEEELTLDLVECDMLEGGFASPDYEGDSSCEASGEDIDSDEETNYGENSKHELGASNSFLHEEPSGRQSSTASPSKSNISRSQSAYNTADRVRSKKCRRARKDRPSSLIFMSDSLNHIDVNHPISMSESAIDALQCSKSDLFTSTPFHKVHHCQSSDNPSPLSTSPRHKPKSRPRQIRRTKSTEEHSASPTSKRQLWSENWLNISVDCCPTPSGVVNSRGEFSDLELNRSCLTEDRSWVQSSLINGLGDIKLQSNSSCTSGSETDCVLYVSAKQSLSESGSESDEFLNSTGSFSETAWDSYQGPLYPTASEAPTEEALHWEPQDDFFEEDEILALNNMLSAKVIAESSFIEKQKAKERKHPTYVREEDSDSDLEDLHHIIQQSNEQLKVTDGSLKKRRHDPMSTGISLDPSKYAEHVLTCETNQACLLEVLDLPVISGHEADQIEDLVDTWKNLHGVAHERLQQSQQLCRMYGDLTKVEATVAEVLTEPKFHFHDVDDLKTAISILQSKIEGLLNCAAHMERTKRSLGLFAEDNPDINVAQFSNKIEKLTTDLDEAIRKSRSRVSELEKNMLLWHEYTENSKALSHDLGQERKRFQLLEFSQSLGMETSDMDMEENLKDLQEISLDLSMFEDPLDHLRSLRVALMEVCSDRTHKSMAANICVMGNELFALRQLAEKSLTKMAVKGETKVSRPLATAQNTRHVQRKSTLQMIMSRIRRAAGPVLMLLAFIYLAFPDTWENLKNLGITITPELHYVRGPPPM